VVQTETIANPSAAKAGQKIIAEEPQIRPDELFENQLKEISAIIFPNEKNFDFAELKAAIKNLKAESLISQIENKKTEKEQLSNMISKEKLTTKTKKELQRMIQNKQNETVELEKQLEKLQIKKQILANLSDSRPELETKIEIPPK
jgi:hypothetical protein